MREMRLEFGNFDFSNMMDREYFLRSPDISYAHFNVGAGKATVVGGITNGKLYYAVSFCSPIDNFDKRIGRETACYYFINNANKRSLINADLTALSPPEALIMALRHYLRGQRHLPTWLKGANISLRGRYKGPR